MRGMWVKDSGLVGKDSDHGGVRRRNIKNKCNSDCTNDNTNLITLKCCKSNTIFFEE